MKIVVTKLGEDGNGADAAVHLYGKCGYLISRIEFDGKLESGEYVREIDVDIDSIKSHMALHSGAFEYRIEE